jgi:hypothetical protein
MAEIKSVIGTQNKKGQTYTDAWKLLNEAPRTPSFFTGSEVIKEAIRRASCDVMIAYPITPQSEAAALIGGSGFRRSTSVHDDRWTWDDARNGELSDVGRRQAADSNDCHLSRDQLTALDSA